ncbi:unnamed protein product [Sphagnum troendelagicum]
MVDCAVAMPVPPPYTSATLVAIAAMRTMPSPAKQLLSGAVAKPERCSQQNSEQRKQTRQPSGAHARRHLSTMTHQEGSDRTGNTGTEPNLR